MQRSFQSIKADERGQLVFRESPSSLMHFYAVCTVKKRKAGLREQATLPPVYGCFRMARRQIGDSIPKKHALESNAPQSRLVAASRELVKLQKVTEDL